MSWKLAPKYRVVCCFVDLQSLHISFVLYNRILLMKVSWILISLPIAVEVCASVDGGCFHYNDVMRAHKWHREADRFTKLINANVPPPLTYPPRQHYHFANKTSTSTVANHHHYFLYKENSQNMSPITGNATTRSHCAVILRLWIRATTKFLFYSTNRIWNQIVLGRGSELFRTYETVD